MTSRSSSSASWPVRAFDWTFRDRRGRVVIGEPANTSIKLFAGGALVSLALPHGRLRSAAGKFATAALTVWALGELFRGANPFRRSSGAIALLAIVFAWLTQRPSRRGRVRAES
jgi:hypothetical protein